MSKLIFGRARVAYNKNYVIRIMSTQSLISYIIRIMYNCILKFFGNWYIYIYIFEKYILPCQTDSKIVLCGQ